MIKCPKCLNPLTNSSECSSCGIVIEKYNQLRAKKLFNLAQKLFQSNNYHDSKRIFNAILASQNVKNIKNKNNIGIKDGCKLYIDRIKEEIASQKKSDSNYPSEQSPTLSSPEIISKSTPAVSDQIECIFCHELVHKKAIKCKHCFSDLAVVSIMAIHKIKNPVEYGGMSHPFYWFLTAIISFLNILIIPLNIWSLFDDSAVLKAQVRACTVTVMLVFLVKLASYMAASYQGIASNHNIFYYEIYYFVSSL